jgi:outer membrane receptor for ferrienterochelin and colicin
MKVIEYPAFITSTLSSSAHQHTSNVNLQWSPTSALDTEANFVYTVPRKCCFKLREQFQESNLATIKHQKYHSMAYDRTYDQGKEVAYTLSSS